MTIEIYKKLKGFTIVEMLVAVTILTIAIGAPLYLATQGVALSIDSKHRLTAIFLAEEAIEYIKHKRDTNVLEMLENVANGQPPQVGGEKWDNYINSPSDCVVNVSTDGCTIDVYTDTISKCMTGGYPSFNDCPFIGERTVGAEKQYGYGGGFTPTIFVRAVGTFRVCSGGPTCNPIDNIEIRVTVLWREKNNTIKSVTVSDYLFETFVN